MTQTPPTVDPIDLASLPKHFDFAAAEERWAERWERDGVFRYDPTQPRERTFVVDTPPPTVSGSLHVGHVFSYTHTDLLARYKRMRGWNVFYPMGWDDNGLPTERRVQNLLHVRCDPETPYEPGLEVAHATAKQRKGPARLVSRPNFTELCHRVTEEDERAFTELFRRIGLSVDWTQKYATIDERCRRLAQLSFLDLLAKGHVYNSFAPTAWDVDFQTAVAQAETEERSQPGAFHRIEFQVEDSDRSFVIATTRPELLPACVGVAAHPEDARYRELIGRRALTPLFGVSVPIFASELVEPEKGTGILMVCTFGDATDVVWWREERLPLRQLIGRSGRLEDVRFGEEPFPSRDPEAACRAYGELAGKSVAQARAAVVELLREPGSGGAAGGPALQGEPEPIEHPVKFYEKGRRPLELVSTRQWFVRLLDKREALLAKGAEIQWHPAFMHQRFSDWTEGLAFDWCLSRQRYFGVPIPSWYPLDDQGNPDYSSPIPAGAESLPVDPTADAPPGYAPEQRGQPGGFAGEPDIFDTWFTSSLTPQIGSGWELDPERHRKLFPADVRPQSHEIIRTWAFYTIAKALLHEDRIPWKHVLVSGWILDPDRKKMSKSQGNVLTPLPLIERYSADGVRYWSASARLGADTAFDEDVLKDGRRLATKIFNAGKFVLSQTAERRPLTAELDRAFAAALAAHVERATAAFEEFRHAAVLRETAGFFWSHFTDSYIELAKLRARGDGRDEAGRGSAVAGLRLGLDVLLRLFAPFLPYVTEEVWSWSLAAERGEPSIHGAPWPGPGDFAGAEAPGRADSFELAEAAWGAINRGKAAAAISTGHPLEKLVLAGSPDGLAGLDAVGADVLAAARCPAWELVADDSLGAGEFRVEELVPGERS